MKLTDFFEYCRQQVLIYFQTILAHRPPASDVLLQGMSYTLLGGGKRLRPALVYAVGSAFQANHSDLNKIAASIEMVHIYSLIHDDLPALDNDDLRHGQPSCHIQFGEDIAIICGDALQSLAFEVLSQPMLQVTAQHQLLILHILAKAISDAGMAGGQALDLLGEKKKLNLQELEKIHRLKTGMLLSAAVEMGAIAGNVDEKNELPYLQNFARHMGLMFQIHDDILDITSSTEKLGKPQGSDLTNDKSTYPALLGLEGAKNRAKEEYQRALENLALLKNRDLSRIKEICYYMIERDH